MNPSDLPRHSGTLYEEIHHACPEAEAPRGAEPVMHQAQRLFPGKGFTNRVTAAFHSIDYTI
ncbi:MAG: hypothetical protein JJU41_00020 [Bacteroidetes bacterium]|nr:hypothetical protein [Bacteroidota bacterium]